MTNSKKVKERKLKQRLELKAKRDRRKERERLRKERRKLKRELKAAPKRSLKEWSRLVGERDGNACAVCGVGVVQKLDKEGQPVIGKKSKRPISIPLHKHHILPKERYKEYRTEVINGVTLCPRHHKYDKFSSHKNPVWFVLWLRKNRPEQYQWAKEHLGGPEL